MKMSELYFRLAEIFKEYEDSQELLEVKNSLDRPYTIAEIQEIYPQLSKHILSDAISKGLLPVTTIGNSRNFYLKDIEEYLQKCTTRNDPLPNLDSYRM